MSQFLQLLTILYLAVAVHSLRTKVFERRILDENRDLRLCVTRQVELDKCNDLKQILLDNKYEYRLECCLNTVNVCIEKVKEGKCDFVILEYQDETLARDIGLRPYLYEDYEKDNYIVALVDEDMSLNAIRTKPLDFDIDDVRSVRAALLLDIVRQGNNVCDSLASLLEDYKSVNGIYREDDNAMDVIRGRLENILRERNRLRQLRNRDEVQNVEGDRDVQPIKLLRSNQLKEYDFNGKVLICPDLKLRDLNSYENCNFDTGSVRTIYGRDSDDEKLYVINYFKQIVNVLGEKYRPQSTNQLRLFGEYRGFKNVLFDNDAVGFSLIRKIRNGIDDIKLDELFCVINRISNNDVNYYRQLLDLDRYRRQFMDQDSYKRNLDENRRYLIVHPNRLSLDLVGKNRQMMSDVDRDLQVMNLERYIQLLNENRQDPNVNGIRQIVNEDVNDLYRVPLQVSNVDYKDVLYNLDRLRQLSNTVESSLQLPDADRFRQMLNLNQYRQQYLYPVYNRQLLDIYQNRDNRINDMNRNNQMLREDKMKIELLDEDQARQYQNVNRLRDEERRQMLGVDKLYQKQNIVSNRQLTDENQKRQGQNLDRFRDVERRQMVDYDQLPKMQNVVGNPQLLDKNEVRQFQNFDRLRDVKSRQMVVDDRSRPILNEDQIRQIKNIVGERQLLDEEQIRQMQKLERLQDVERRQMVADDQLRKMQNVVGNRQLLDENEIRQSQNFDRLRDVKRRQMVNEDQLRQIQNNFGNRQLLDENQKRQIQNLDSFLDVERRQMVDDDQLRKMQNIVGNRQLLDKKEIRQSQNFDRLRDVKRRQMVDEDQLREMQNNFGNRQLLDENQIRQIQNLDRFRDVERYQMVDDDRSRQILNEDQIRQMKNIVGERQLLDEEQIRQMQNLERLQDVERRQLVDDDQLRKMQNVVGNRQLLDENEIRQSQNFDRLRDVKRRQMVNEDQLREMQNNIGSRQLLDEDKIRQIEKVNRLRDVDPYRQMYGVDRSRQMQNEEKLRQMQNLYRNHQLLDDVQVRQIFGGDLYRQYSNDNLVYRRNYGNDFDTRKYLDEDRYSISRQNIDTEPEGVSNRRRQRISRSGH